MMRSVRLGFVDIETGGLDPEKHAILEIACGWVTPDGTIEATWHETLSVLAGTEVSAEAAALHGLPSPHGSRPRDVIIRAMDFFRGTIPAGNNTRFDLAFLEAYARRLGLPSFQWYDHHVLDLSAIAMLPWLRGELPSVSLAAMPIAGFGPSHRAWPDMRKSIEVFRAFLAATKDVRFFPENGWELCYFCRCKALLDFNGSPVCAFHRVNPSPTECPECFAR